MLVLFQNSFAENPNVSLPVYITNNSSHTIHLLNSLYSSTPLNFDVNVVPPYSQKIQVATINSDESNKMDVSFFIYPDNELNGNAPLIIRRMGTTDDTFGIINLDTCVNNNRNDCVAVNFSMFTGDMDFEIKPTTDPKQNQKELKAKWSHYPNVTAYFDFDKSEMKLTKNK